MDICNHCGAVWDENHATNGCPVAEATATLLRPTPENPPEGRVAFNNTYSYRQNGDGTHRPINVFADEDGTLRWEYAE